MTLKQKNILIYFKAKIWTKFYCSNFLAILSTLILICYLLIVYTRDLLKYAKKKNCNKFVWYFVYYLEFKNFTFFFSLPNCKFSMFSNIMQFLFAVKKPFDTWATKNIKYCRTQPVILMKIAKQSENVIFLRLCSFNIFRLFSFFSFVLGCSL